MPFVASVYRHASVVASDNFVSSGSCIAVSLYTLVDTWQYAYHGRIKCETWKKGDWHPRWRYIQYMTGKCLNSNPVAHFLNHLVGKCAHVLLTKLLICSCDKGLRDE